MQENKEKDGWQSVEGCLASEIIKGRERVSKAKDFAIWCLTVAIIAITIGLSIINYKNDVDWRELFSSYDYVSQDWNGYNYYNSDIGGDVNNGSENQAAKESQKGEGK